MMSHAFAHWSGPATKTVIETFERDGGQKRLEVAVVTPENAFAYTHVALYREFPTGTWTPIRTDGIRLDSRAHEALTQAMRLVEESNRTFTARQPKAARAPGAAPWLHTRAPAARGENR